MANKTPGPRKFALHTPKAQVNEPTAANRAGFFLKFYFHFGWRWDTVFFFDARSLISRVSAIFFLGCFLVFFWCFCCFWEVFFVFFVFFCFFAR